LPIRLPHLAEATGTAAAGAVCHLLETPPGKVGETRITPRLTSPVACFLAGAQPMDPAIHSGIPSLSSSPRICSDRVPNSLFSGARPNSALLRELRKPIHVLNAHPGGTRISRTSSDHLFDHQPPSKSSTCSASLGGRSKSNISVRYPNWIKNIHSSARFIPEYHAYLRPIKNLGISGVLGANLHRPELVGRCGVDACG
jgi:hypothetical protein